MIDTLSRLCGQRWPRLLPPMMAACYCGMFHGEFRKFDVLNEAKVIVNGKEKFDRFELDRIIDELKASGEFTAK